MYMHICTCVDQHSGMFVTIQKLEWLFTQFTPTAKAI